MQFDVLAMNVNRPLRGACNMVNGPFDRLEMEIKHLIEKLEEEQKNPPELRNTTTRLLGEAKELDECLQDRDTGRYKRLLRDMQDEANKARTFAKIWPDLPEKTQKNLEYLQYSIDSLCQQAGLN